MKRVLSVQVYDMQGKLLRQLVVPPGEREITDGITVRYLYCEVADRKDAGAKLLVVE